MLSWVRMVPEDVSETTAYEKEGAVRCEAHGHVSSYLRHFRVTFHISLNLAHSFMRSELIFVIKGNITGEVSHVWERTCLVWESLWNQSLETP